MSSVFRCYILSHYECALHIRIRYDADKSKLNLYQVIKRRILDLPLLLLQIHHKISLTSCFCLGTKSRLLRRKRSVESFLVQMTLKSFKIGGGIGTSLSLGNFAMENKSFSAETVPTLGHLLVVWAGT